MFINIEWNKRKEMENVKGESTTVSLSCNMTVRPARTCPSGYECKQISILKGADGICMKKNLAKEGEACGKSINQACRKDLICAPLGPSYKLLNTIASEVELTTETETVSTEVRTCIGKTENEIKGGCLPYIPYYGACVKKGVWPPPPLKPTPTPPSTCRPRTGCMDPPPGQTPCIVKALPGTIFCTPTPTPFNRCNSLCISNADCGTDLICFKVGSYELESCRNPQCPTESDCLCSPPPIKTLTPTPTVTRGITDAGCVRTGCSGQGCASKNSGGGGSTCEWRDQYLCAQLADCKMQTDGSCKLVGNSSSTSCYSSLPTTTKN